MKDLPKARAEGATKRKGRKPGKEQNNDNAGILEEGKVGGP